MFFYPMKEHIYSPGKIGIQYEDVYIDTADGLKLHGWFLPSLQANPKASILFLHGNAENISTHVGAVYWLPNYGFNVLIYDYRGYGKSEGQVDLDATMTDVKPVIDYMTNRADVNASKLIIFGQSLGGAIAINTVANHQKKKNIKAVVIESSFTGFRQIAREKLGESWLTWAFQWPLSLTITNDYSSEKALTKLAGIPVLIIHGNKDHIIPFRHGKTLYQAALPPKDFWIVPEGGHIQAMTLTTYREKLVEYFESILKESN